MVTRVAKKIGPWKSSEDIKISTLKDLYEVKDFEWYRLESINIQV